MRIIVFIILQLYAIVIFARPPVKFIQNKNQWAKDIHFVSRIPGGNMQLKEGGFSYVLWDMDLLENLHEQSHKVEANLFQESSTSIVDGVRVNVNFIGSNKNAERKSFGKSSEYYNFFIGNDPLHWGSKAYAFDTVTYLQFYNGIDLKVYAHNENVKYDLVVDLNADPSQIMVSYEGADRLELDNGNLYVQTKFGKIIERKPYAYQLINGVRVEVKCEFLLFGNLLRFVFPEGYDPCYQLIIDPLLIFSTFSGSQADNWGSTATPGEHGTLYSAGVTNEHFGGTFPATAGVFQTSYAGIYDIGILKYDSLGERLLYAAYLGGEESESAHSLVVNSQGELLVLGTTSSRNFPVSPGAFDGTYNGGSAVEHVVAYENGCDIIVSRISQDGTSLLASTYLGGSENDGINDNVLNQNYGDHLRGDIITDVDGNIYVSSVTESEDFGGAIGFHGGETDAIVMKLPSSLSSVTWAKFIGGSGTDAAHTIKLDEQKNIYIAGGTTSIDFPSTTGVFQKGKAGDTDGWIGKLDNNGNITSITYTGTVNYDQVYFIDLNLAGEVYAYGQTTGSRAMSAGVYNNPNSGQFLQKFSNDLKEEKFYTVFGTGKGSPDISPTSFMVSDCNYIYASGWGGLLNSRFGGFSTATTNLPVTPDALQGSTYGHDFYFMVLSEDAKNLLYATFLGGNLSGTHVDGGTSRFEKTGVVYHAVCAGCSGTTPSGDPASDFPTTPTAWSRTNNSGNCNNAAFKFDLSTLRARLELKTAEKICLPGTAVFENISIGGREYTWDFGDGTPLLSKDELTSEEHEYTQPGSYKVWLKAIDEGTCKVKDSVSVNVFVYDSESEFPEDATICRGTSQTLTASGGVTYTWSSKDNQYYQSGSQNSITVSPKDSTLFYISIIEASGCMEQDSAWVHVIPDITPDFSYERTADCSEIIPELSVKNLTDSLLAGDYLYFDFDDGITSDLEEVVHRYEESGTYNVKLVVMREFCVWEKTIPMTYGSMLYPNVITPGNAEGLNDAFVIRLGDTGKTPLDFGFKTELRVYDRWGKLVYENDNYQHNWNASELSGGVYYFYISIDEHVPCKGWLHVVK